MRKLLVVLFLALLTGLAALPYWFGIQAQRAYERATQNRGAPNGVTVTDHTFHRGWLGSTATMTLSYPGAPFEFRVNHRIDHGPLPILRWRSDEWDWSPVAAKVSSEVRVVRAEANDEHVDAGLPFIVSETVVDLAGAGKAVFDFRDVTSNSRGSLRGAQGQLRFSPNLKRWQIELGITEVSLIGATLAAQGIESLGAKNLRFTADLSESTHGYRLGTTELVIGELGANPVLKLQNVRFHSVTRPNGSEIDVATTHKIDEIHVSDQSVGSLRMAVDVTHFDAKAMDQFESDVVQLSRTHVSVEQLSLQMIGKILNLLAVLSKTAPEFEIREFVFNTEQGDIKGHAKFILDGRKVDATQNPLLLLVALRGDAELEISSSIIRSFFAAEIARDIKNLKAGGKLKRSEASQLDEEALRNAIDEALPLYVASHKVGHYLQPHGDYYKVTTAIRRGQVFINGELWQGTLPGAR